jgi:enoyl-CoA hydratase/carnithine racemase
LTADCGLIWSLPQRVGRTLARDLLFTGRPVTAEEAHRIGIVDQLVPAGNALATALAKAGDYRDVAPLSIAAMKFAFAQGPGRLSESLALELQQQPMLSMTGDHAEGIAAFREKRPARFTGH